MISKNTFFLLSPFTTIVLLVLTIHAIGQNTENISCGLYYSFSSLDLNKTYFREELNYDGDEVSNLLTQEELDELNRAEYSKNFQSVGIQIFSGYTGDTNNFFRFGVGFTTGIDLGNEKIIYNNQISDYYFKHNLSAYAGAFFDLDFKINKNISVFLMPEIFYHSGEINNYQQTDADSIFGNYIGKEITYDNIYRLTMTDAKVGLRYSSGKFCMFVGPEILYNYYELDFSKTINDTDDFSITTEKNFIEAKNSSSFKIFAGANYYISNKISGYIKSSVGKDFIISGGISYSFNN